MRIVAARALCARRMEEAEAAEAAEAAAKLAKSLWARWTCVHSGLLRLVSIYQDFGCCRQI